MDYNIIQSLILNNYGIKVRRLEIIDGNLSLIYKIYTDSGNYLLKILESSHKEKNILKEINVINFLKEKNLIVPKCVQCLNGDFYFKYNDKIVIMQEFIEGATKTLNFGDKEHLLDSAKNLGKLVTALEDYPYDDIKIYNVDINESNNFLNKTRIKFNKLIKIASKDQKNGVRIINDLNDKLDMLTSLLSTNIFKDLHNISIKYSHGDYNVRQFIYDNDKIKVVIDFESVAKIPVIWDIIRSYHYIDKEYKNGNFNIPNLVDYTREYMKYNYLNKYDLKYMPYLYLAQLLNSTFGYKQYLENGNEELFNFAHDRTMACKYLFNNASKISVELLKIYKNDNN